MKLSGKNFQSWAEFNIEIDGLTVVTGPSDVGKSALFRALKGVVRNELPAEYVRDDQDDLMEVVLEIGGHKITAQRKKKGSTTYVIDGKDFAKLAGGVPTELKDLKFTEVVIGDFDFDPIFGRQNSAQFLIDPLTYKPTEINAVLGAFGGTEKLEHGKKEANLRKTQRDAEARTIADQIRSAEERKAKLTVMQVEGEKLGAALQELEHDIRKLEIETHWLGRAEHHRQEIVKYRQILDAFVLPDIAGISKLQQEIVYAEQAALAAAFAKWLAKPIATLSSVPAIWTEVRSLWNEIAAVEAAVNAGKHVISTDKLKSSLCDAEMTFNEAIRLWRGINAVEVLASLLGELKGSAEKLTGVEAELSAAQAKLQAGLCEKCGKPREHICA